MQTHISPPINPQSYNGLTVEQLDQVDWSQIDLSEFINDLLQEAKKNIANASDVEELREKLINNVSGSAGSSTQPIDNLNVHP